jgi:hypothetical protein
VYIHEVLLLFVLESCKCPIKHRRSEEKKTAKKICASKEHKMANNTGRCDNDYSVKGR